MDNTIKVKALIDKIDTLLTGLDEEMQLDQIARQHGYNDNGRTRIRVNGKREALLEILEFIKDEIKEERRTQQ